MWRGGSAVSSFSPWGGRVCSRVSPPRRSLPPCLSSPGVSPPRSRIQRVSLPRGSLHPGLPYSWVSPPRRSLLRGGLLPGVSPARSPLLLGLSSRGSLPPRSPLLLGLSCPGVSPARGLVSVPPPSGPSMTLRVRSVSFGCLPFAGAAVGSTSLERPPHRALKAQEGLRPGAQL